MQLTNVASPCRYFHFSHFSQLQNDDDWSEIVLELFLQNDEDDDDDDD